MTRGESCGKRCLSCSPIDCENSIVFSRVVEDADPYRVSLKFMVLGSPIDCGNLVVFSGAPWCSRFRSQIFLFLWERRPLQRLNPVFTGRRGRLAKGLLEISKEGGKISVAYRKADLLRRQLGMR